MELYDVTIRIKIEEHPNGIDTGLRLLAVIANMLEIDNNDEISKRIQSIQHWVPKPVTYPAGGYRNAITGELII